MDERMTTVKITKTKNGRYRDSETNLFVRLKDCVEMTIDFDEVLSELMNAEVDDEGIRRVFIGTVFALYPSGKYYTPFACSNVTEAEADLDEVWREKAEAEADKRGIWLEGGEGDPCDIFAAMNDEPERDCGIDCAGIDNECPECGESEGRKTGEKGNIVFMECLKCNFPFHLHGGK